MYRALALVAKLGRSSLSGAAALREHEEENERSSYFTPDRLRRTNLPVLCARLACPCFLSHA